MRAAWQSLSAAHSWTTEPLAGAGLGQTTRFGMDSIQEKQTSKHPPPQNEPNTHTKPTKPINQTKKQHTENNNKNSNTNQNNPTLKNKRN